MINREMTGERIKSIYMDFPIMPTTKLKVAMVEEEYYR